MKYCDSCHTTYPTEFATCPKDQSVLRHIADLAEGMVLRGKYEILEKIGMGGMAAVYRVRHLHLQEEVAIKVVSSRLAEEKDFVDRFKTEAVITRKLRHPNAVRLDDFDTTEDGRPFIVMEYVRGESLRQVLRKNGWLPASRAADIARQAARALAAAHQLGIVHRDIKPENILLVAQPDGTDLVKVLDFGIAKVRKGAFDPGPGYTPTQTGLVLGTPQYLSPEQARGKQGEGEVDGRADLYALGIVLYEMLTGRVPFNADNPLDLLLHHLQTPPTPPHLANSSLNISPAMSELVMKALEKDPAKRLQTGEEMAEALSNPEVLVQAAPAAHAFSTSALAAAAAGLGERASAQVASPAATPIHPATVAVNGGVRVDTVLTNLPLAAAAPKKRLQKWMIVAAGAGAVVIVLAVLLALRASESVAGATAPPSPPAVAERIYAPPSRAASNRRTAAPPVRRREIPTQRPREDDSWQHERAQQLVDQGYRRLQHRDYAGACDAFQAALEIEPDNADAQRGLKTAVTAQTISGVTGVLRR